MWCTNTHLLQHRCEVQGSFLLCGSWGANSNLTTLQQVLTTFSLKVIFPALQQYIL